MRSALRSTSAVEYYTYITVEDVAGHILTAIGEERDPTGDIVHPIVGPRVTSGKYRSPSDPFSAYGDRDVILLHIQDQAGYFASLVGGGRTGIDGRVFTIHTIALDGAGDPIEDGEANYSFEVFSATVISVADVGDDFVVTLESENAQESDSVTWASIRGKPTMGDMDKATYDTNDDGRVDAADHATNADLAANATTAAAVPWAGITGIPALADMFKSVYDTNDDGVVDYADSAKVALSALHATTAGDADTLDGNEAAYFATKSSVDNLTAASVAYDNGVSGLAATDVQAAVDEVAGMVGGGLSTELRVLLHPQDSVDHSLAGSPVSVSQFVFDGSKYSGTVKFSTLMWVSGPTGALQAQVSLYNLSDGEAVTGTTLTSTAAGATHSLSGALTVGAAAGNLKNTEKVYEVRLEILNSADPADTAHYGHIELVSS